MKMALSDDGLERAGPCDTGSILIAFDLFIYLYWKQRVKLSDYERVKCRLRAVSLYENYSPHSLFFRGI
jgi:hypothetical protein